MHQVTMNAVINNQRTKVLFAEADSEFTDILFSFLSLPLGKIVRRLDTYYVPVGSLSNLYRSVMDLNSASFTSEAAKQMLLNPRTLFEDVCPSNELGTDPIRYFSCGQSYCFGPNICISMYSASGKCDFCRHSLCREIEIMDRNVSGLTANVQSFVIYDDLRVEPYSSGFLQTIRNFDSSDTKGAVQMTLTFDTHGIIEFLRCCLRSETPLSDYILQSSPAKQSSPKVQLKTAKTEDGCSKYISLKMMLQKSTNKLLFVEAGADFIELLFSFLTIPLGGVLSMLENNASGKSVDNLYKSIAAMDEKFFRASDLKNRLVNPKLAPGYSCRKQFLPLSEETAPKLYKCDGKLYHKSNGSNYALVSSLRTPKGLDNYVTERNSYVVTDDLTVTPFVLVSGLILLERKNIPRCDVDELEVLGILRASLSSTSALSSGLINLLPKKVVPKVEQQLVGQIV